MNEENQPEAGSPGKQTPPPLAASTVPAKHPGSQFTVLGACAFAVGAACLVLALLITVNRHSVFRFRHPGVRRLHELQLLNLPGQLPQARSLCTDHGFAILSGFSANGIDLLGSFQIVSRISNPDFTDVEMVRNSAEGKAVIWARMVNQGGWKLDDIYFKQAKERQIHLWASEAMSHPVRAWAVVHADEISTDVNAVNTGLDTLSRVLNVAAQLRALDQDSHSQRY